MKLKVDDYPQLKLLCWSRPSAIEIEGEEALGLYENGWRFVDQEAMTQAERELIDELARVYGNGVLNV